MHYFLLSHNAMLFFREILKTPADIFYYLLIDIIIWHNMLVEHFYICMQNYPLMFILK